MAAGRIDDAQYLIDRFFLFILRIDNTVVKFLHALHFADRLGNAQIDAFGRICLTIAQAPDQIRFRWRPQEDANGGWYFAFDRRRALNIEAHNHILPAGQSIAHMVFGNTFVLIVNDRILQQLIFFNHVREFIIADK